MKKLIALSIILILLFSFNIYAQENQKLNVDEDTNLEELDLSQEKDFSQSAREELLGIASKFDSEEDQAIDQLAFENYNFSLTETTLNNSQHLNILNDLDFDANYSQKEDEKLETTANFQLEYALNSRTSIRAGYSILNEEWWDIKNSSQANIEDSNQNINDDQNIDDDFKPDNDNPAAVNNNVRKVYQNELESSRSLGVAYKSNERVTLSADFIDNNKFGDYYDEDWELAGDSTVFGVEYNYPEGSSIRASYQVDTADEITQRITGVDFAFNNLATFSASYKLLDLNQLTDDLNQQKTAWDLGIGVNISEDYGLALGYELIEGEDEEEAEKKIRASFEIDF
ncbi:hypothetical protein HSACCH_01830 [Halanaerobium saccharolyticum subsp. saccharolyticum DSM 6643]|uniref:Uncharacterized protein n=1 Tax=Halanaerobium saccharolyticum subsp. saccharolyticum DSM 6643 TaxID=1293054 RepID=M5EFS4_9FIRM|nr:hypothetical protein [Halanaerobium saccharolyticum]CCU80074.1 hypothetical protein HSACCH_01830 [Halanaerobium saccharolyticum subsp. saccharolyticum DSM 6643]